VPRAEFRELIASIRIPGGNEPGDLVRLKTQTESRAVTISLADLTDDGQLTLLDAGPTSETRHGIGP
jgi:hypothetical protein